MRCDTPRIVASKISSLSSREAAKELVRLQKTFDNEYVQSILMKLQDYDRLRHGQDDTWWLEMMHEVGPEISRLF